MANISNDGTFLIMPALSCADGRRRCLSADYLRSREMAERAAAKASSIPAARAAHQELAQRYAQLTGESAAER